MHIKLQRKYWIAAAATIAVACAVVAIIRLPLIRSTINSPIATPTASGQWYDDCPACPTYPVQPTHTPEPTPTCRPCVSPTPYPPSTAYPPQPWGTPPPTPSPTPAPPTATPTGQPSGRTLKYYGVDTVQPADFGLLAQYHINTVFITLDANGSQTEWAAYLDEAEQHNLMVMVWPLGGGGDCGFPYDGTDISGVHRLLDYLATKDNFVAILNAHEPFWSCPMTVEEMAAIKTKIKTYVTQNHGREIEVFNHIDNFDDHYFQNAKPEDIGRILDVSGVWKHCFNGEGSCQYMVERTIADRQEIQQAGFEEDVDLVLLFQTFGMSSYAYRMPTAQEMQEWACAALQTDALDGFFWYTWDNPSSYSQYLSKDRYDSSNQDRWEVMRYVWENCVNQPPTPEPTATPTPPPAATPTPAPGPALFFGTFLRTDASIAPWFNQIARAGDMAGAKSQAAHLLDDVTAGQRMVIFASVATAEQVLPGIADDIDLVGYNIESWEYTPADEKADPVGSIQRMRILADAHNLQVGLGPDYHFLSNYGEAMVPYTNFFFIQVQAIQDDPERLINFTTETAQALRQANPDIQVAFQLTTAISAGEMIYITERLEAEVDGVWILASAGTVDVMQEFVNLLRP